MHTFFGLILCFTVSFGFAFGMAWMLPLVAAGVDHRKAAAVTRVDTFFGLVDVILLIMDCIPFFWVFRSLSETPSACGAARKKWQEESSIRWSFHLFLICMVTTLSLSWLLFK